MTRRPSLLLLAVGIWLAACGRAGQSNDSARADSATLDTSAAARSLNVTSPGEPPPPPLDTGATLRLVDGGATADTDSVRVAVHYDSTAAAGLEITFTGTQSDSVTVSEGAYIRAGGATGATGQGTITARTARGVIVADLAQGIRNGSALTKCAAQPSPGRGRCGVVMLEVRFTPRTGQEIRRNARLDLGN